MGTDHHERYLKYKEYHTLYTERTKEKRREYKKIYNAKNKEKIKARPNRVAYNKARYEANKEKVKKQVRESKDRRYIEEHTLKCQTLDDISSYKESVMNRHRPKCKDHFMSLWEVIEANINVLSL